MNSLKAAVLLLTIWASPVLAWDACDDLWFSRNFEFDQVGHCFKSPLGFHIFRSDCQVLNPVLSDAAKARVDVIKTREAELGCRVDSQRQSLDIEDQKHRFLISSQPVVNGGESMCIGWLGARKDLFGSDLLRKGEAVVGEIWPGDDIMFRYDDSNDFTFVQTYRDGRYQSQGWTLLNLHGDDCRDFAG